MLKEEVPEGTGYRKEVQVREAKEQNEKKGELTADDSEPYKPC